MASSPYTSESQSPTFGAYAVSPIFPESTAPQFPAKLAVPPQYTPPEGDSLPQLLSSSPLSLPTNSTPLDYCTSFDEDSHSTRPEALFADALADEGLVSTQLTPFQLLSSLDQLVTDAWSNLATEPAQDAIIDWDACDVSCGGCSEPLTHCTCPATEAGCFFGECPDEKW
ncbi:hypothetical protein H4R34_002277 [Dimargaris verticillata]|uniref:Uncharacterized protein n=1 Tax=Dimargaris verticillata TaxID=2761393 RepID=A0A9W8B447_9FUNG|nr:hypothetical protein H4R34_002277 [Dimargaris verticillata]